MAEDEAKQVASGASVDDLKKVAANAEHGREQRFKEHFELIAIITLWVFAGGMFIAALVWFYHLISPMYWPRLSENQVDDIQTLLTGALIVGVLAGHFKKRIG